MANLLATQRANPYRVRAYRTAAETILSLEEDIADKLKRQELELLPGVGRDLAGKIQEYLETGTIRSYEALKNPLPEEASDWASLPGLSESMVGISLFSTRYSNTERFGNTGSLPSHADHAGDLLDRKMSFFR